MIKINDLNYPLSLPIDAENLTLFVAKKLNVSKEEIFSVEILRKSLDARKKHDIHYKLTLAVKLARESTALLYKKAEIYTPSPPLIFPQYNKDKPPIVIGFGPAGIFSALALAMMGGNPIVLERGDRVEGRQVRVNEFWEKAIFNTESNVLFGEGGAGTFSDGKLNTGTKSPYHRFILETFVRHGAPKEILYESKPHIGTDRLVSVVTSIRKEIVDRGGTVIFGGKFIGFKKKKDCIRGVFYYHNGVLKELEGETIILAVGHSARDTYEMLYSEGIMMEQKPFSIGLRIEHLQCEINKSMYGKKIALPPAAYSLKAKIGDRGVYSFCMCPGGYVVQCPSELNSVATNGMSRYKRDGENANSALLVSVNTTDFPSAHPLAGIELQRTIERKAFISAGGDYKAPIFKLGDFLQNKSQGSGCRRIKPTIMPGYSIVSPKEYLPGFITDSLKEALPYFENKIKGFLNEEAILTGPETGSSSPVRILRHKNGQSVTLKGLYPVGEGAGYAGGIMSSAADGIKAAVMTINNTL